MEGVDKEVEMECMKSAVAAFIVCAAIKSIFYVVLN